MKKYFKWIKIAESNFFDICFILGTGWNALHEALPVLVWIKEHHSDVKILSIIGENNAKEQTLLNEKYYKLLLEYSDGLIMQDWMQTGFYPLRRLHLSIHKKIYRKYMPVQMDNLLKGIGIKNVIYADSKLPVFRYIFDKYLPQMGVRYYNTGEISFESMGEFLGDLPVDCVKYTSVYFAKDEIYAQNLRKQFKNLKVVMLGSPKLDPWWLDKHKKLFCDKNEYIGGGENKIAIALPKLDDRNRLTANEKEQLNLFMNNNKKFDYIIAFHPRDDIRHREKFLKKINVKYKVWDGDLMTLSEISDVLVYVGQSTGQADCIVTEKPLILFYDDFVPKEGLYTLPNGKHGVFFQLHDIVLHARTAKELSEKIYGCLHEGLWDKYMYKYKEYIPRLSSCKLIAEYILDDNK